MKKIITYSVVALALVSSSLVYAQNSSTVSEYTPVVISNFEKTLPQNKCQVPSTKLAFGDGLKNGKTAQVKILQEHLIGQGYLSADATGYFGPLTLSAVKKFQKKEGVINTGYVGPLTLGKIKQKCSMPIAMCGYAAPPEGCRYVAGPKYDKQTQCGMILSCGEGAGYQPPVNCKSWYDGCNTCGRSTPGGPMYCTKRACISVDDGESLIKDAKCNAYFETGKTCTAFGVIYKEGQSASCIETAEGYKACIADATHVCRAGIWKIEGGMPVKPFPIKPTQPIACTMEARLCADGSMMPRGDDCTWYPEKCAMKQY